MFHRKASKNTSLTSFCLQVHSDEFLPAHISTSKDVKYETVDAQAIIHNPRKSTGGSRYFNWVGGYSVPSFPLARCAKTPIESTCM